MRINSKIHQAKWFKLEEKSKIEFLIKVCPFSTLKLGELADELKLQFMEDLVDWRGLVDENNKPFKCTKENKELIYNFYGDIREFVFQKSKSLSNDIEEELDNLDK